MLESAGDIGLFPSLQEFSLYTPFLKRIINKEV